MKLSSLTNRQQDILKLLYRYRFLNRKQIQALLGHHDKKHTIAWLKDLRVKHYVEWIYSSDFAEKTKPAIYYIGINGVRFLKSTGEFPIDEIRKRYKENKRSDGYITHAILLGDICISLSQKSRESIHYTWHTPADYANPDNVCHFLSSEDSVHPDLCFAKQEASPENKTTKAYLLELFDVTLPRYRVRSRLKNYAAFLQYGDWEQATGEDRPPTVLLVCPTLTELIYAKRRIRKLLEYVSDETCVIIKCTTLAEVKKYGVMGEIWET